MYAIKGLCHRTDISMGAHGFIIDLHPSFPDLVLKSELTQEKINRILESSGRIWLDNVGYNEIFDPDNCGFEADKDLPPGPDSHPLHRPGFDLRVSWDKWGPEHISVPGNACGLDIERKSLGCIFKDGASFYPHNVDSWRQKYLLLITFTEIAHSIILLSRDLKNE